MFRFAPVVSLTLASAVFAQTYTATYTPEDAPKISEQGQSGTNQCGTGSDQNSMCQNVYVNSLDDFCVYAPPSPGPGSAIENTERIEVAWCVQGGHGTRVIPDGAITGAHFVQTPDYVQVTGVGDLTKINIPEGNSGGELDPHGADGKGNPIGGLVFSSAFGSMAQMHEWTNFMGFNQFCIRACKDGPKARALCGHIYDVMGCEWNMPGDYSSGSFDSCMGDSGEPMGVYGTSTFHQGQPATPPAHAAPPKSQCNPVSTIGNGLSITTTGAASSGATSSATTSGSAAGSASVPTGSKSMSTTRSSAGAAPSASNGSSASNPSASNGSSASSPSGTGGAANSAASLLGRGLEVAMTAAAVIAGAVFVA